MLLHVSTCLINETVEQTVSSQRGAEAAAGSPKQSPRTFLFVPHSKKGSRIEAQKKKGKVILHQLVTSFDLLQYSMIYYNTAA